MINKIQFKQMARHVLRKQRGLRDPQIMHPERDWSIGIFVALAIFFFSIFWSIYAYIENKNISFESASAPSTEVVVYRESLVKSSLEQFDARAKVLNRLVGIASPIPEVELATASSSEASVPTTETIIVDDESTATSTEE